MTYLRPHRGSPPARRPCCAGVGHCEERAGGLDGHLIPCRRRHSSPGRAAVPYPVLQTWIWLFAWNMSFARHVHFVLALQTSDAGVRTCSRCLLRYGMRRALATPSASWASSGIITSRCSPRPRRHMLRSPCGIPMGQQSPEADGSCGLGPNEGFEGDWPGYCLGQVSQTKSSSGTNKGECFRCRSSPC